MRDLTSGQIVDQLAGQLGPASPEAFAGVASDWHCQVVNLSIPAQIGLAQLGPAWLGPAWLGPAQQRPARPGLAIAVQQARRRQHVRSRTRPGTRIMTRIMTRISQPAPRRRPRARRNSATRPDTDPARRGPCRTSAPGTASWQAGEPQKSPCAQRGSLLQCSGRITKEFSRGCREPTSWPGKLQQSPSAACRAHAFSLGGGPEGGAGPDLTTGRTPTVKSRAARSRRALRSPPW